MKGDYKTSEAPEAGVTLVEIGDGRDFLVVKYNIRGFKTLVFELQKSPDCWISRREIAGIADPVGAVTGHLLSQHTPDPVSQMKKDLEQARRLNWALQTELIGLKETKAGKKRGGGKRGRRNS